MHTHQCCAVVPMTPPRPATGGMAGSDAEADASEAEAAGGEPLNPPLNPAATPLSDNARPTVVPAAAVGGISLAKGTSLRPASCRSPATPARH